MAVTIIPFGANNYKVVKILSCYYVHSILSMPGGIEYLINNFDVDGKIMKYNKALYQADIEKYGIFTYEKFAKLFRFLAKYSMRNGEYLKILLGKGLITKEQLGRLIESYAKFFM